MTDAKMCVCVVVVWGGGVVVIKIIFGVADVFGCGF